MGLFDYPTLIKKPMDLGTVKRNITQRKYKTIPEAAGTNLVVVIAMLFDEVIAVDCGDLNMVEDFYCLNRVSHVVVPTPSVCYRLPSISAFLLFLVISQNPTRHHTQLDNR
jgi:hypothetical protein